MVLKYQKDRPHPGTVQFVTRSEAVERAALQAIEQLGREVLRGKHVELSGPALMRLAYRRVRRAMRVVEWR